MDSETRQMVKRIVVASCCVGNKKPPLIYKYIQERWGVIYSFTNLLPILKRVNLVSTYHVSEKTKRLIRRFYCSDVSSEKIMNYLRQKQYYTGTWESIIAMCNTYRKRHPDWSGYRTNKSRDPEFRKKIVDMYASGCTQKEIKEALGIRSWNGVKYSLVASGVELRDPLGEISKRTPYADFSMEKIDSKFKAYFLGLMMTDGCVSDERQRILFETTDKDLVNFIVQNTGMRLYIKPEREAMWRGKVIHQKELYRLSAYGKRFVEQFARFGVVPRKTFIMTPRGFVNEETPFFPYILRGIIDGDGTIYKTKKGAMAFSIGKPSKGLIDWCHHLCRELGMRNLNVYSEKTDTFWGNGIDMYLIRSRSNYNAKILRDKVYDVPFGMSRKYNILHSMEE